MEVEQLQGAGLLQRSVHIPGHTAVDQGQCRSLTVSLTQVLGTIKGRGDVAVHHESDIFGKSQVPDLDLINAAHGIPLTALLLVKKVVSLGYRS